MLSSRHIAADAALEAGELIGTAAYSSLEALQNARDDGCGDGGGGGGGFDLPCNDAYAAGVTLLQLLTGSLPVAVAEEERTS